MLPIWKKSGLWDVGFNLYRSSTADTLGTKINDTPITEPTGPDSAQQYTFIDDPGPGTFYYHLEAVKPDGSQTQLGVVQVKIAAEAGDSLLYLPLVHGQQ